MATEIHHAGDEFNSLGLIGIARKALGGIQVSLRPYEKCITIRIEADSVTMVFETFQVRETRTRTVFEKSGKRMTSYSRADRVKIGEMTIWDEELNAPGAIVNFGRVNTPDAERERVAFERDCYRPGSDRAPLDNYARVTAGPTAPKMERHW